MSDLERNVRKKAAQSGLSLRFLFGISGIDRSPFYSEREFSDGYTRKLEKLESFLDILINSESRLRAEIHD